MSLIFVYILLCRCKSTRNMLKVTRSRLDLDHSMCKALVSARIFVCCFCFRFYVAQACFFFFWQVAHTDQYASTPKLRAIEKKAMKKLCCIERCNKFKIPVIMRAFKIIMPIHILLLTLIIITGLSETAKCEYCHAKIIGVERADLSHMRGLHK